MMNFWDHLGRLHTKPVTDTNPYPTNNAYIYTAYYSVLYDLIAHPTLPDKMPFSRHPYKKDQPPISHDELHGVSILDQNLAADIVDYLDDNHNQFCDIEGFTPNPFYKLNWFKVLPALYTVFTADNQRHETLNNPVMWNVAFWQRPEYRWFYKRAAGRTPTVYERIVFTIARSISILTWKKDDPNVLLWASLEHLEQNLKLGIEGKVVKFLLKRKVKKLYRDTEDMFRHKTKDLAAEYQDFHPWFE